MLTILGFYFSFNIYFTEHMGTKVEGESQISINFQHIQY